MINKGLFFKKKKNLDRQFGSHLCFRVHLTDVCRFSKEELSNMGTHLITFPIG